MEQNSTGVENKNLTSKTSTMTAGTEEKEKTIFVTVGTTKFDKLVTAALSKTALNWMVSQGYTNLTIQYGTGTEPVLPMNYVPISIRTYDFQPSLDTDMKSADMILSHAGAGTVMEALRLRKKLVVVVNNLLMNNHQTELAGALAERNHLFMVRKPEDLDDPSTWSSFKDFCPTEHRKGDETDFPRLLDACLGFLPPKKVA